MNPPALSIPRYELDSLLWQAAQQAGVEAHRTAKFGRVGGDGPFQLDTAQAKSRAKAVIVAAGRWSSFSRRTP